MRERPAPFFHLQHQIKMTTLTLNPGKVKPEELAAAEAAAAEGAAVTKGLAAAVAEAEAAKAAPAEAAKVPPKADKVEAAPAPLNPFTGLVGKRAWLRAVHGDMVNLHTNERFTTDPKKAKIDTFIASQLEAGKMELHVEEE